MGEHLDTQQLWELYADKVYMEGLSLETFVDQLLTQQYGTIEKSQMDALLDDVEKDIRANIELKLDERPEWAGDAEERSDEVTHRFEALRQKVSRYFEENT
ncbi:MAG: hypothetical protein IMW91_01805 [Firmicutes bacterium]|nr:hypothetical protein [Bacillota bacterium]